MKHLTICLALLASPASANEPMELCAALGTMAENIMIARQNDVPISVSLGITNNVEEPYKSLATSVILDAYRSPGYSSQEMQDRAAKAFRNRWEVRCVEAFVGNV